MNVYLIRHTSVDVSSTTCYGQTDVPLKDTFEEEAAVVKKNLEGIHFDSQYTSPLSRCFKLAAYCGYPDAVRDERLKEVNFGDWESKEFYLINDPHFSEWMKDPIHIPATHGESFAQLYDRVTAFLDDLRNFQLENVAIFAHGGVLLCAQAYAGLIAFEEALEYLSPYGGIVQITL